jgi:HD domain-containing protein
MLKVYSGEPTAQRAPLIEQARGLATTLQTEFGVPFLLLDPATGQRVWPPSEEEDFTLNRRPGPAFSTRLAQESRARVVPLAPDCFQLTLPLYDGERLLGVATAELPALAAEGPARAQEQARLQKWAQRVCEDLRSCRRPAGRRGGEPAPAAPTKTAWEALLALDQVIRRLRFHKAPERNRRLLVEAAFPLLGVQALAWVPQDSGDPVLTHGEASLGAAEYRDLAACVAQRPEWTGTGPFWSNQVQNESWGQGFAGVVNLMAFPVFDQSLAGWVIALNKGTGERGRAEGTASFRGSDAALVTAFVALFELTERSSRKYQGLRDVLVELLRSLTAAHDAKDARTFGHSERVGRIAVELGRALGLGKNDLGDLYLAGLLHDIGKIGTPDPPGERRGVTPTCGSADDGEYLKKHVSVGYAILANLPPFRHLLPAVLHHHEHVDGSGYPKGLAGEAIPPFARILAVAEAYDDLSMAQPDRPPLPCRQVEQILLQGSGRRWDPAVVEAFLRCRQAIHAIRQRGVGESLRQAFDATLQKEGSSVLEELAEVSTALG